MSQQKKKNTASKKAKANAKQQKRTPMSAKPLMLSSAQADSAVSTYFRFKPGANGHSCVIEGRDLAATALTASSGAGAFVIDVKPLSVATATQLVTRWGTYGALFCKWRIKRLKATLVSGQATTTVGFNYVAFDPTQSTLGDPAAAETLMRFEGSALSVAYANCQSTFVPETQLTWYDTLGAAGPTNQPGQLFVGSDGYAASVVPGKVLIDYELEFAIPR